MLPLFCSHALCTKCVGIFISLKNRGKRSTPLNNLLNETCLATKMRMMRYVHFWAQIQGDRGTCPPHNFEDGGHNGGHKWGTQMSPPPTNLGIGHTYITVI